MTNQDLFEKVGKKSFLDNEHTLANKLNYISGIPSFDKYLDGKSVKEIGAVIHLTEYPKGLVFAIKNFFSSFPPIGLAYSEIKRTVLVEEPETSSLIFETVDNQKIFFSLHNSNIPQVRTFFDDIDLKCDFEKKNPTQNSSKKGKVNLFWREKKEINTNPRNRNNKYPALVVIILLIKLISILNLFGWILISIKINDFAVFLDRIGLSTLSNSWVLTLLLGIISSIFIWGVAESKQVIIDIESNTRKK